MDSRDLAILNRTFVGLIPYSELAPRLFHERLLVLEPELRVLTAPGVLFPSEILAKALALMIQALSQPDRGERLARYVGFRYRQLGLEPKHYPSVGEAMIWTFRHILGEGLGPQEEDAWRNGYAVLAGFMELGASQDPLRSNVRTLL